ncbi:Rieske 2Fe-2S domain-containing protein [Ideonella sp. DXS22W]|uniref:Rieske 2Fe-2S domain-containing protein n=1 Tax=Pseudaquabacterium inlustre TaxID=2984192 RepID=A0ABU9CNI1_9BURK
MMPNDSPAPTPAAPCAGCDAGRRAALQRLACGALATSGLASAEAWSAEQGPQPGDWLVSVDADKPVPLTVADLKPNAKQQQAWPCDPKTMKLRDQSRLNRVLLVRLDAVALDAETARRAADGVMAYSSVCTHQGCDVSAWREQEKTLLCFCHFSQFQPAQGAAVVAGPAPRPLPALPLRVEGGRLIVAGGFTQPPGGHKA